MKLDLGYKPNYWPGMPDSLVNTKREEQKEPPTVYPQMSLEGNAAAKLIGKKVKPGDIITATVSFRVVEVEMKVKRNVEHSFGDSDKSSVDLEVHSLDDVQIGGKEPAEEEEPDAEDAVSAYLAEKGLAPVDKD